MNKTVLNAMSSESNKIQAREVKQKEVMDIVKQAQNTRDLLHYEFKVKIDSRVDELIKLQYEAVGNEAVYKKMLEILKKLNSYKLR